MTDISATPSDGASVAGGRSEWATGWPTLLAGIAGMTMCGLTTYVSGMFVAPLHEAFGWNRGEIMSALAVVSLCSFFAFPFVGRLADRYGVKAVALPGPLVCGALLGLVGLVNNGSLVVWWLSWAVFSVGFAMINPGLWAKAVSLRFEVSRGMALAVLVSGGVLASLTIPQLSGWAIETFGWRLGYGVVGLIIGGVTSALVLVGIPARGAGASAGGGHGTGAAATGLDYAAAIRRPAVIKLLACSAIVIFIMTGCVVNMVPLLTERGIDRAAAAGAMSAFGAAGLVTKLLCGWISDRLGAGGVSVVAALAYAATVPASAILIVSGSDLRLAMVALACLGAAAGAVLQLSAYLTLRHAGERSYGQVYGLCAGLLAVGGGLGPAMAGMIYDQAGSYTPFFIGTIPVGLLVGLTMLSLGSYPVFGRPQAPAAA